MASNWKAFKKFFKVCWIWIITCGGHFHCFHTRVEPGLPTSSVQSDSISKIAYPRASIPHDAPSRFDTPYTGPGAHEGNYPPGRVPSPQGAHPVAAEVGPSSSHSIPNIMVTKASCY